jgi:hypothetical protein
LAASAIASSSGYSPIARKNAWLLAAGQIALTVTPVGAHSRAAVRAEPFETRPAKPAICISLKLSRVSDSMTVRDGHLVPLIKRPYAGTAGKTHEDPRLASCWGNSRRQVLEEPAFDRQGG